VAARVLHGRVAFGLNGLSISVVSRSLLYNENAETAGITISLISGFRMNTRFWYVKGIKL